MKGLVFAIYSLPHSRKLLIWIKMFYNNRRVVISPKYIPCLLYLILTLLLIWCWCWSFAQRLTSDRYKLSKAHSYLKNYRWIHIKLLIGLSKAHLNILRCDVFFCLFKKLTTHNISTLTGLCGIFFYLNQTYGSLLTTELEVLICVRRRATKNSYMMNEIKKQN